MRQWRGKGEMPEDWSAREITGVVPIGGSDVSVTLRLKATKPFEKDDKWKTNLIAYLSRDRRRPIPNQPLFLHRNGAEVGISPKTRAQGEFSCDVELPGSGEYVLTVGIPDTAFWAGVTVSVPVSSKKSPEQEAIDRIKLGIEFVGETKKLKDKVEEVAPKAVPIRKARISVVQELATSSHYGVWLAVFNGEDKRIPAGVVYVDHEEASSLPVPTVAYVGANGIRVVRLRRFSQARVITFALKRDQTITASVTVPALEPIALESEDVRKHREKIAELVQKKELATSEFETREAEKKLVPPATPKVRLRVSRPIGPAGDRKVPVVVLTEDGKPVANFTYCVRKDAVEEFRTTGSGGTDVVSIIVSRGAEATVEIIAGEDVWRGLFIGAS